MSDRWPRHPFTLPVVALATLALVFVLPAPWGPIGLAGGMVTVALLLGEGAVLGQALLAALPPAILLVLLHGVWGTGTPIDIAGVNVSRGGLKLAATQEARLVAVLVASALVLVRFDAARFIDATAARRWRPHWAFLLVATLQAVPRLVARARQVAVAQSARGLSRRGGPLARVRGLVPLAIPLILGAIVEADDRAVALEMRGAGTATPRTVLTTPQDAFGERLVRWVAVFTVVAVLAWRARP
jgi:energy-coupling factor transport system permease protein